MRATALPGVRSRQLALAETGFQYWPVPVVIPFPVDPQSPATFGAFVPLVQGSDEVVVTTAQFDVEARPDPRSLPPTLGTFVGHGIAVTFPSEVRLTEIELAAELVLPNSKDPDSHFVIRSATRSGNTYVAGPPVYAIPPFSAGEMFGELLAGATLSGRKISFPAIAGSAFVFQLAKGSSALALEATGTPAVTRLWVDAVPRDVTIAVTGNAGRQLWSDGGLLLPGTRETVSFVPAAQSALTAAFKAANETTAGLELALQATTASSGTLAINSGRVAGEYVARPSDQPRRVTLQGSSELVSLDVPAGATPSSGTLSLSARFLGRQLNDAYQSGPDELPPAGLRVHPARSAAVLAPFAPLAGAPPESSLALASLRLPLIAFGDAEVAVELHAVTAGMPGELLAPHSVRQLEANFRGWCEIVLPQPLALTAGGSGIWVVLRATKGDVLWCGAADAEGRSLTSTDEGTTWSEPAAPFGTRLMPLIQLFHAAVTPSTIDIEWQIRDDYPFVRRAGSPAWRGWTLVRAGGGVDFEAAAECPPELLAWFGATRGTRRASADVRFFSRSALELTLDAMTLSYPFDAQVG